MIEVGIDFPNANIIVIENANKFGLAQLHQLRGRVGRGNKESTCILLFKEGLSKNSIQRIKILKKSDDGFFIAEEDLKNVFVYVLDNGCHESVCGFECAGLGESLLGINRVFQITNDGKKDRVGLDCQKNTKQIKELF